MLRQKDEENGVVLSCSANGMIYSNDMFELHQVYTVNEKKQMNDERINKKEKRYKTALVILTILFVLCAVTAAVSSFFVSERTAVPYNSDDGKYFRINIVSLEPSLNEYIENGVYYDFIGETGEIGTLVFDEKAQESDVVKKLLGGENETPVTVYGSNVDVEKKSSFVGTVPSDVFKASLEPKKEFPLCFGVAVCFGLWLGIADLIVAFYYRKEKKSHRSQV